MRSLPARLFLGSLVAAIAVAGAMVTFSVRSWDYGGLFLRGDYRLNPGCVGAVCAGFNRPAWVMPLGLFILTVGAGGGVAIAASGLRFRNKR